MAAIGAAAVAASLGFGALGCGGDDEATAGPFDEDAWTERAAGFCLDAIQEATALPLPASVSDLATDAAARAEIVASVRDGLLTLGRPDDVSEEDLSAYLGELDADIEALGTLSQAAESGADVQEPLAQIDESAGSIATELDLPDCAALAQAVARTP